MKIMHRKVVHLLVFAISTSPKIHFVCVFLDPNTRKQFCICIIYILLGRLKVPKEDEDNAYAKLFMCLVGGGGGGKKHTKKVNYGRCGNGKLVKRLCTWLYMWSVNPRY